MSSFFNPGHTPQGRAPAAANVSEADASTQKRSGTELGSASKRAATVTFGGTSSMSGRHSLPQRPVLPTSALSRPSLPAGGQQQEHLMQAQQEQARTEEARKVQNATRVFTKLTLCPTVSDARSKAFMFMR